MLIKKFHLCNFWNVISAKYNMILPPYYEKISDFMLRSRLQYTGGTSLYMAISSINCYDF